MGRKQSEKRRTVRQTLAFMAASLLTLSGCAGNSGGTVYLSAVSRLKLEISGDGMVREVEALNKAGSALLGDSAFDNRTSTETLDALIPLMQTEDADTVFVDVFSDDKNWENQTVADYAERYGSDEESLAEGALQVEVRKVTDLDEVGEAVLPEETDPTEPDGEALEDLVIVPAGGETPEEDGEEGAEESTEESIEESTEESTEDSAEESQEEAEDAASARPAETTAARERETTAAARTQAAPETASPETAAPETAAPETAAPETEVPETAAPETAAPETETPETAEAESEPQEAEAASDETEPEETAEIGPGMEGTEAEIEAPSDAAGGSGTANQGYGAQRDESMMVRLPNGETEVPYGPGW